MRIQKFIRELKKIDVANDNRFIFFIMIINIFNVFKNRKILNYFIFI